MTINPLFDIVKTKEYWLCHFCNKHIPKGSYCVRGSYNKHSGLFDHFPNYRYCLDCIPKLNEAEKVYLVLLQELQGNILDIKHIVKYEKTKYENNNLVAQLKAEQGTSRKK